MMLIYIIEKLTYKILGYLAKLITINTVIKMVCLNNKVYHSLVCSSKISKHVKYESEL